MVENRRGWEYEEEGQEGEEPSPLENRLEFEQSNFCHNRHKPFVHCPGRVEYSFRVVSFNREKKNGGIHHSGNSSFQFIGCSLYEEKSCINFFF